VADNPDLPETKELKDALLEGYTVAARKQLDLREFDAAADLVAEGSSLAPDYAVFQKMLSEIDSAKSASRRRLGAY